jgi:hypothetical protein
VKFEISPEIQDKGKLRSSMRDTAWFKAETLRTVGADDVFASGRSGDIVVFFKTVNGARRYKKGARAVLARQKLVRIKDV